MEYNAFRIWTLAVCAGNVIMRDLSVVNAALRPASLRSKLPRCPLLRASFKNLSSPGG